MNIDVGNAVSRPNIYSAGGVLIFGWRRESGWPSNNDATTLQSPKKIMDAAVGFQAEGGLQETICWNDAMLFDVTLDQYHHFVLLRRKLAANSAAHGSPP